MSREQKVGRWEAARHIVWLCRCHIRWNSSKAECANCGCMRPPLPETATVPQPGAGEPCGENCGACCNQCGDAPDGLPFPTAVVRRDLWLALRFAATEQAVAQLDEIAGRMGIAPCAESEPVPAFHLRIADAMVAALSRPAQPATGGRDADATEAFVQQWLKDEVGDEIKAAAQAAMLLRRAEESAIDGCLRTLVQSLYTLAEKAYTAGLNMARDTAPAPAELTEEARTELCVEYVAGFLFAAGGSRVALVRKARPEWQAGKLNAIGGHIEPGETPHEAMVREFEEETRVRVEEWDHVATLRGEGFAVWFYRAECAEMPTLVGSDDEPVSWYYPPTVEGLSMPNLRWLMPLAMANRSNDWPLLAVEKFGAALSASSAASPAREGTAEGGAA